MNDQALTLYIASKTEIDFILELRYAIRMSCCTQKERKKRVGEVWADWGAIMAVSLGLLVYEVFELNGNTCT